MDEVKYSNNPRENILERNLRKESLKTSIPYLSSILQDSAEVSVGHKYSYSVTETIESELSGRVTQD